MHKYMQFDSYTYLNFEAYIWKKENNFIKPFTILIYFIVCERERQTNDILRDS